MDSRAFPLLSYENKPFEWTFLKIAFDRGTEISGRTSKRKKEIFFTKNEALLCYVLQFQIENLVIIMYRKALKSKSKNSVGELICPWVK